MIPVAKHAKIVIKSTMKRKISTGAALYTQVTGVVKCGGAVVSKKRMTGAVNSVNMSRKKTKMMPMRIVKQQRN